MKIRRYSVRTIHRYKSSLKMMNLWMMLRFHKEIHAVAKEEISSILDRIPNAKHYVAVALMYGSGLDISETVRLRVKDVDIDQLTIPPWRGQ